MIFELLVAVVVTYLAVQLGRASRRFACRPPKFEGVFVDLSLGLAAVVAVVLWFEVFAGVIV